MRVPRSSFWFQRTLNFNHLKRNRIISMNKVCKIMHEICLTGFVCVFKCIKINSIYNSFERMYRDYMGRGICQVSYDYVTNSPHIQMPK